jgi:hypothetical protein
MSERRHIQIGSYRRRDGTAVQGHPRGQSYRTAAIGTGALVLGALAAGVSGPALVAAAVAVAGVSVVIRNRDASARFGQQIFGALSVSAVTTAREIRRSWRASRRTKRYNEVIDALGRYAGSDQRMAELQGKLGQLGQRNSDRLMTLMMRAESGLRRAGHGREYRGRLRRGSWALLKLLGELERRETGHARSFYSYVWSAPLSHWVDPARHPLFVGRETRDAKLARRQKRLSELERETRRHAAGDLARETGVLMPTETAELTSFIDILLYSR